MKDTLEKIKNLLGRDVEVKEITFKNQKGYIPLFFDYTFNNHVSSIFDTDKETCLNKFLSFLQKNKGDTNGTDT